MLYEVITEFVHRREGRGDLVGVVGEVVDHRDAARAAHGFEAAADAGEARERRRGTVERDAAGPGGGERGHRVGDVVPPGHLEADRDRRAAGLADGEADAVDLGHDICGEQVGGGVSEGIGEAARRRDSYNFV